MRKRLLYFIGGLLALIIVVNLSILAVVKLEISPFWDEFERGRIIKIGSTVFIFGHGAWETDSSATEKHFTIAFYQGKSIHVPTLDLVKSLHEEGARRIWGTWCYAGDRPYIQRDLVTGSEIAWPEYVSRSKSAGVVYPVWLLLGFARFTDGKASTPHALFDAAAIDTVLVPFSMSDVNEETPETFRERIKEYIRIGIASKGYYRIQPDSVGEVYRDTVVYANPIPLSEVAPVARSRWGNIVTPEKEDPLISARRKYWTEYGKQKKAATKTVEATMWIRGKAMKVWLKLEPYTVDINGLHAKDSLKTKKE